MSAEKEARFEDLVRALLHNPWTADQYMKAMQGFFLREHSEESHPEQRDLVAELSTASLAPLEKDAWLFGYRFRDTADLGGDGDGNRGSV